MQPLVRTSARSRAWHIWVVCRTDFSADETPGVLNRDARWRDFLPGACCTGKQRAHEHNGNVGDGSLFDMGKRCNRDDSVADLERRGGRRSWTSDCLSLVDRTVEQQMCGVYGRCVVFRISFALLLHFVCRWISFSAARLRGFECAPPCRSSCNYYMPCGLSCGVAASSRSGKARHRTGQARN